MSDEPVDLTDEERLRKQDEEDAGSGRRMTFAAIIVSAFLLLSRFAGFAKEIVLAKLFGASAATDAYKLVYNQIVYTVYTKIEKLERPCYLPLFVKRKEESGEGPAWEFGGAVMLIHAGLLVIIALLCVAFAPFIISTLWPKLIVGSEGHTLAVLLLRVMAPALVLFSLSVMPELTLHSYKEFTIPALAEAAFKLLLVGSLVALAILVWRPDQPNGILAAGVGVVIGGSARFLVQLPAFKRHWRVPSIGGAFGHVIAELRAVPLWLIRYPHHLVGWIGALTVTVALTWHLAKMNWLMAGIWGLIGIGVVLLSWLLKLISGAVQSSGLNEALEARSADVTAARNRDVARLWGLIPPILVGLSYSILRGYIDSRCSTAIGEGAYSCLDYARKLPDTLAQILPLAVSFVVYPFLSEWAQRGRKDRLADALVQTTRAIAFVFIPASIWMMVARRPVIWAAYGGGEFTPDKQALAFLALMAYAPGMAFFSIEGILNKWYFALDDTKTPNYVGAACAILHVFIAVVGVYTLNLGDYSILAVALALTVSKSTKVIVLYWLLRGRVGKIEWGPVLSFAVRMALACAAMGAAVYFCQDFLGARIEIDGRKAALVHLAGTSAVAAVVFLGAATVLRIEETWMVIDHLKKRVLRRGS